MPISHHRQHTILVVDDTPHNIKVLFNFLDEAGFKVLVAKDGESALKKLQEVSPDLILLDVMMPGIDGFETCHRLKANEKTRDIPVIFMTALCDTVDKVKGLTLGAVDYITKPLQYEEVLARIDVHLRLQQEIKERTAAENALKQMALELEQRVQERTAALSQSLTQLQQAQIQLVQSEKLSMLGALLAGVAHEINNPVAFINTNLIYLESYINNLVHHLQAYKQEYPHPTPKIQEEAEVIELDYLLEDLPQLISSMKDGADRLSSLSNSLRSFSRSDPKSQIEFNIHEGLDSTLVIFKHRFKANAKRPAIEIIKEYGELPKLMCYPGQLNQVFMNLIANAIDALEESNKGHTFDEIQKRPNKILIRTEVNYKNTHAFVYIKDNGSGMNEEVKKQIFDYLFTTKPVGAGTGIGLSISRQIIEEKHQGTIKCISAPGEGACFIIELPLI